MRDESHTIAGHVRCFALNGRETFEPNANMSSGRRSRWRCVEFPSRRSGRTAWHALTNLCFGTCPAANRHSFEWSPAGTRSRPPESLAPTFGLSRQLETFHPRRGPARRAGQARLRPTTGGQGRVEHDPAWPGYARSFCSAPAVFSHVLLGWALCSLIGRLLAPAAIFIVIRGVRIPQTIIEFGLRIGRHGAHIRALVCAGKPADPCAQPPGYAKPEISVSSFPTF